MNNNNLTDYLERGFLFFDNYTVNITEDLENKITGSAHSVKFYESDGKTIRSFYGFHRDTHIKEWIQLQKPIQEICKKIYPNEEIYIHQSKVNFKNNIESSVWPFHRDFPFWNVFDGISDNRLLNVVIFMDDVNEDNGALSFIPGSQNYFLEREKEFANQSYSLEGSASNNLDFDFTQIEVESLKLKFGTELITGPKGSIVIFNPDLVHGSSFSTKYFSRKLMLLTFNVCNNKPEIPAIRPEYLCSTDFSPIKWNKK